MRLRLYHHGDGARVAYRETGTGPTLALLHSAMLSHKEWEPLVDSLSDRFRLVLPDLPLHGDSEAGSAFPYTREWFLDVLAGFSAEVLGPRPLLGGHDLGAELALHATLDGRITPSRLVLMPNRMHGSPTHARLRRTWRIAVRAAAVPGLDRALSYGAQAVFRPELGPKLRPAARPRRRTSSATPSPTSAATPSSPAPGPASPPAGRPAPRSSCWPPTPGSTSRSCCCGPTTTPCIRWRSPRRLSS